MEMKKVEVEVLKEAYEVGDALAKLVVAIQLAVKDGFQPGTDLPMLVVQAVQLLPQALDGVDKLPAEAKEDPAKFVQSLLLPLSEMVSSLLKK